MIERVHHPLAPWWQEDAKVLILGSLPSPQSRQKGMYYGHPQNRFWQTLAALFSEATPQDADTAKKFCLRHHLALWDVVASCLIDGAKDASMREVNVNDFAELFAHTDLHAIFCTGRKAYDLFQTHLADKSPVPARLLPSPSAANRAHWPDDRLLKAYQPIWDILHPFDTEAPPLFPVASSLLACADDGIGEDVTILYEDDFIRLERIIGWAHPSPEKGFYDQDDWEWVTVLEGHAVLEDVFGTRRTLHAGDHCTIFPHQRHRVAATSSPCIWLCLFQKTGADPLCSE